MRKKKILFVIHNMNLGGTEKSLLALLDIIDSSRNEITVLLLEDFGALKSSIPSHVTVEILNGFEKYKHIIQDPPARTITSFFKKKEFYSASYLTSLWILAKLTNNWAFFYRFVLTNTPVIGSYDTAIAYAGPSDFISYLIVKKVQAKQKIQWIHFDVTKVLSNANFGNKYYTYFHTIVCVSKSAKSVFDEYFPKFSDKTIVFENIVSVTKLNELAEVGPTFDDNFNGLRLLTLGRISAEKGQFMIPEIVKVLLSQKKSFKWYCIGDGTEFSALQQEISKRELHAYIVLLGAKLNPYGFLKDCDIYVQTSLHEGYGITMKEAKCFNRPCVVTNVVSAKDFFSNGENAIITDINPQSIGEGVLKLIEQDSLRILFEERLKQESNDYEDHATTMGKIFF